MNKELDEALCKEFASIFRDRHGDMKETCMCWGIDCGDGWFDLIRTICRFIDNSVRNAKSDIIYEYKKKNNIDYTTDLSSDILNELQIDRISVVASQVKEKYGSLRFYTDTHGLPDRFDHEIDGAISFAEDLSSRICETCGHRGQLRGSGWLFTACEEHSKGVKTLKEYQDFEDSLTNKSKESL